MAQDWSNFAIVTGGASGALTGLLFVAVSLSRERIVGHPVLRGQAGQTLVLFLLPLLISVLLVVPGVSPNALGASLLVLAIAAGLILVSIGREKKPADAAAGAEQAAVAEEPLVRLLDKVSPNLLATVLILVAGLVQLAGADGLYWLAASSVISLISGVVNAWLFMTRS